MKWTFRARRIEDLEYSYLFKYFSFNLSFTLTGLSAGIALHMIGFQAFLSHPEDFNILVMEILKSLIEQSFPLFFVLGGLVAFYSIFIKPLAQKEIHENLVEIVNLAKRGDKVASDEVGRHYESEGAYGLALRWFDRAIELGSRIAKIRAERLRRKMRRERLFAALRGVWSKISKPPR